MKFGFIEWRRNVWPVAWLCEALGVSRSGFHAWLGRGPSERARTDEALMPLIRSSLTISIRIYGARRVWREGIGGGGVVRPAQDRAALPMPFGRGRSGGRSSVITASDQRSPSRRMCSTGSFRPISQTVNGSPTSPISGRPKDDSTLRPLSISSRAVSSAGR